ncbi:unnamed protein product [Protopolystoma xenopodis]|uniref:Uncharacterized protein n=1 Tax=Protopolystoma xenopodis TaxID=117903 RepID=A0A448XBK8_9PLAT|nr:unnamed protein product [Protopolystoma xenopodis]
MQSMAATAAALASSACVLGSGSESHQLHHIPTPIGSGYQVGSASRVCVGEELSSVRGSGGSISNTTTGGGGGHDHGSGNRNAGGENATTAGYTCLSAGSGQSSSTDDPLAGLLDLNATDALGRTALHWAAVTDQPEVVRHLLAAGASLDSQTQRDETSLALAAREGALSVCGLLLAGGANPDLADHLDRTPRQLAEISGHEAVVRLLISASTAAAAATATGQLVTVLSDEASSTFACVANIHHQRTPHSSQHAHLQSNMMHSHSQQTQHQSQEPQLQQQQQHQHQLNAHHQQSNGLTTSSPDARGGSASAYYQLAPLASPMAAW